MRISAIISPSSYSLEDFCSMLVSMAQELDCSFFFAFVIFGAAIFWLKLEDQLVKRKI